MQRRANNQQLSPCCCGVTRLWLCSIVLIALVPLSADGNSWKKKKNTHDRIGGGFFKSKRGRVTGSPSPSSRGNRGKKRIFTSCFTTYLLRHFSFVILVKFLFIVFTFLFFIFFFDGDFRARRLLPQPVTTANQVQNQRRKTKIT